jgi:hypothetical protein
MKIISSPPNQGFRLEGEHENLLWAKYLFFKAGISPREFRKIQRRDVKDILDIKEALDIKEKRVHKINSILERVKW